MLLTEDHSDALYQIKSYEPHKITINNKVYTQNLIISSDQLITNWDAKNLLQLTDLKPEIILLGTGEKNVAMSIEQLKSLYELGFSPECMSTRAAAHTYTILISEGRRVVAGLIL